MNEDVLKRAIEIKKTLDTARQVRADIEEKRKLCTGNTTEVASRRFELEITDGVYIKRIRVGSRAAHEALTLEWKNADEVVKMIENEMEQL